MRGTAATAVLLLLGPMLGTTVAAQPPPTERVRLPRIWRMPVREAVVRLSVRGSDTLVVGRDPLTLGRNEILAARVGDSAVVGRTAGAADSGSGPVPTPGTAVYEMPFRYATLIGGAVRGLRPVYVIQGPLRYNDELGTFQGTILVRIEDTTDIGLRLPLDPPLGLAIGGDADSLAPATLSFAGTGTYERLTFFARAPLDVVSIQLVPPFDPIGTTASVRVRPSLAFEHPARRIEAFGIGSARLRVGVRGTVLADSMAISVSSDRGSLSADEIRIGPSGGTVTFRSSGGPGMATVGVTGPGLDEAKTVVAFGWPVAFAGAAVAGGVFGAVGAQLRRRRRGRKSAWLRNVAGATIGAVVATTVYVGLGVNLVSTVVTAPLTNELAVFAFAALGSMLGLNLAAARGEGGTTPG